MGPGEAEPAATASRRLPYPGMAAPALQPLRLPGYSEGTAQPAHGTAITEGCVHPKGPETGPGGRGAGTATSLSHHTSCAGRLTREGPPPLTLRAVTPEFCWRGPLSPFPLKPGDQASAGPECP